MGVWSEYKWNSAKALNGFLIAILFPLPLFYFSTVSVQECARNTFFSWDVTSSWCAWSTHFTLLALVALFIPMWLLSIVQGQGWLNDLYWTLVPVAALYHYTLIAVRFEAVNSFRLGLLWGVLLLWSLRLTHNYSRREEWTWGAREDFRYQVPKIEEFKPLAC